MVTMSVFKMAGNVFGLREVKTTEGKASEFIN